MQERQINDGELFFYELCPNCGTLQIMDAPQKMEAYYKKDTYYADAMIPKKHRLSMLVRCVGVQRLITNGGFHMPYTLQYILRSILPSLMNIYGTGVKRESRILDVGGGNGSWAYKLFNEWGYKKVTVIDRYCSEGSFISKDVRYIRGDICEIDMKEKFDLIIFNHSFEHMSDPDLVLKKTRELMNESSKLLIRIPCIPSMAWNKFRENWYQIDAPRHYFIYSERAIRMLCNRHGLEVEHVLCDSKPSQFSISDQYQNTSLCFDEIALNDRCSLRNVIETIRSNRMGEGDQAAFYIKLTQ